MSVPETAGSLRYFSGENEDGREYKRWKTWARNKLLTMDKLPETSHGAFIYTLLSGRALETVEHLEPADYQKKGGDKVLWDLLDIRFPQKDTVDELAEILGEVFSLQSKDGETMKQWVARSSELLDRCYRKTGVQFPDEARGWLLLNRAGLSEEQRAVVISRARGSLQREAISAALRSCYPDLVISRGRKSVALVDEALAVDAGVSDEWPGENEFDDVDALLQDHQFGLDEQASGDLFAEADVAEVLAASWKEKRMELSKLNKARQFNRAKETKRSFRIEVEELKKRTTCHKCGKKGHWSRECRSQGGSKGSGRGSDAQASSSSASGAAVVESTQLDFVASVQSSVSLLDRMRTFCGDRQMEQPVPICLVSSPGFGVLDSGCGRTIIGAHTLSEFEKLISSPIERSSEMHQFKFGNGHVETSRISVQIPVMLAGRRGCIRAAVIKGAAPLLISRMALKNLHASIDFGQDCLTVFGDQQVPLIINEAGQYMVNLLEPPCSQEAGSSTFAEVMMSEPDSVGTCPPADGVSLPASLPEADSTTEHPISLPCHVWSQEHAGVTQIPYLSSQGPKWKDVRYRVVRDAESLVILDEQRFIHKVPQGQTLEQVSAQPRNVIVEFFMRESQLRSCLHRCHRLMLLSHPRTV